MVARSSFLSTIISSAVVSVCLFAVHSLAAPNEVKINFTPPLATAKTIQVTEVVWQAQGSSEPGPLHQTGKMTFRIERPDKFWVEWKENNPSKPASYTISDGHTIVTYEGKQFQSLHSQPAATSEWPYPMMGLLNNMPGPVSAMPAIRDGKKILLAVLKSGADRSEFWLDPKTHLLVRWSMIMTWHGKTSEVMRTEYSGWILNASLPPAVFHISPTNTVHK